MKFLTFGEIMLRLKSPGHEKLFQSPALEATFGGGEANVAVSLANYGQDVGFLSVLPENAVGVYSLRPVYSLSGERAAEEIWLSPEADAQ